jgi:hypothetical protein
VIGASALLYAICTALMVPAMAQLDFTKLSAKSLSTGPVIFMLTLETIYSTIAMVLIVVWLIWYSFLIDWARGRGVAVPGNATALACWFVPFVNLVHPVVTLRQIQLGTSVRTPLEWWWALFITSIAMSAWAMGNLVHGGYDPIFTAASAIEIVAVYLCWRIAIDFRHADQAWDPAQALASRDSQSESTSAAPS